METKEDEVKMATQNDVQYLSRRVDRIETTMFERLSAISKRIRLLVRILVDKKVVGPELAKSVEETFGANPDADALLDWLIEMLEK